MNSEDAFDKPWCALVRKELLVALRKGRTFGFVLAFGLTASLWVISTWPSDLSIAAAAGVSDLLFTVVVVGLYSACWFVVPVIAAAGVLNEMEQNTSESIRLTMLRSKDIVRAKLLNSVGLVIMCLIVFLPFFAVGFFLVGLDWNEAAGASIVLISGVVRFGAIGLWAATCCRNSVSAALLAYVIMLAFGATLRILPVFVVSGRAPWGAGAAFSMSVSGLLGLDLGGGSKSASPAGALVAACANLFVSLLCYVWAVGRIWRPAKDRGVGNVDFVSGDYAARKNGTRGRGLWLNVGWNPILLKEILIDTSSGRRALIGVLLFMCCVPPIVAVAIGRVEGIPISAYLLGGVVVLMCPAIGARTFNSEKERDTFDMLRMTAMTPREIVIGKLLSGVFQVAPLWIPSMIWFAVCVGHGSMSVYSCVSVSVALVLACVEILSITIFVSLVTKRVVGSVMVIFAYLFATLMPILLLIPFGAIVLSPIMLYGVFLEGIWIVGAPVGFPVLVVFGIMLSIVRILIYIGIDVDFYKGTMVDP